MRSLCPFLVCGAKWAQQFSQEQGMPQTQGAQWLVTLVNTGSGPPWCYLHHRWQHRQDKIFLIWNLNLCGHVSSIFWNHRVKLHSLTSSTPCRLHQFITHRSWLDEFRGGAVYLHPSPTEQSSLGTSAGAFAHSTILVIPCLLERKDSSFREACHCLRLKWLQFGPSELEDMYDIYDIYFYIKKLVKWKTHCHSNAQDLYFKKSMYDSSRMFTINSLLYSKLNWVSIKCILLATSDSYVSYSIKKGLFPS